MEELLYLAVGSVAGAVVGPRLRALLLEAVAAGYKAADVVSAKASEQRKSFDTFLAEARARARPRAKAGG
jgi:hypothetical protein